jgi:kynureninase
MQWLKDCGASPDKIHAHVKSLQATFLAALTAENFKLLPVASMVPPANQPRGNFCTFDLAGGDAAAEVESRLSAQRIRADKRGSRLRLGFGIYQDQAFIERLIARMRKALTV